MLRIAIVSCVVLPEPDLDEPLLVAALRARGTEPEVVAWDDVHVDYTRFDVAVLRSTWNYHLDREGFVAWAERTSRRTRLFADPATVRWNSDKAYLRELEQRGIPVVPTEHVPRGSEAELREIVQRRGWSRVVVKPRVSAGSFETHAYRVADLVGGELAVHARERDVMVQPYVASVDGEGERAIVCIEGTPTHAVRKSPRFTGQEESVSVMPIAEDERALAHRVLATQPAPPLYARVDLARESDGSLVLMELELVEPSLFFAQHPPALALFCHALLARARCGPDR